MHDKPSGGPGWLSCLSGNSPHRADASRLRLKKTRCEAGGTPQPFCPGITRSPIRRHLKMIPHPGGQTKGTSRNSTHEARQLISSKTIHSDSYGNEEQIQGSVRETWQRNRKNEARFTYGAFPFIKPENDSRKKFSEAPSSDSSHKGLPGGTPNTARPHWGKPATSHHGHNAPLPPSSPLPGWHSGAGTAD